MLADEGSFFVNGKVVTTQYSSAPAAGLPAPGKTIVNQMYVRYMIPDKVREYSYKSGKKTVKAKVPAIIMIHGSGHTGATFETTPDGREGWANLFRAPGLPGLQRRSFGPRTLWLQPGRHQQGQDRKQRVDPSKRREDDS